MLKVNHHQHGEEQAEDVSDKAGIEVDILATIKTDVKSQQKGNEDAGNYNVSQTEHGKLISVDSILQEILWEDKLDWSVKRFGHGNHHIGAKNPENVVHK